ncbi:MAG: CopG family transcriptional regulator [Chloroflexi bacterium]|nr:CopG family transcriptional regulator [Chloroflexota bacterium]
MAVKIAISIEKPLFDEVEALAKEMKVSRSHLFSLATRELIQRRKNQKLIDAINAAYEEPADAAEARLRARMKSRHRQLVKDQW